MRYRVSTSIGPRLHIAVWQPLPQKSCQQKLQVVALENEGYIDSLVPNNCFNQRKVFQTGVNVLKNGELLFENYFIGSW